MSKTIRRACALAMVFAIGITTVTYADTAIADGDNATPVVAHALAMGDVCRNTTETQDALLAISRSGNYGTTNVFKKGSSVTWSVVSADAGLSATFPGGASGSIPANWDTVANNTMSPPVSTRVAYAAPDSTGSFSGTITFRATGIRDDGTTLARDTTMTVSAIRISCDTTAPIITPFIDGTLGLNGWYVSDVTVTFSVADSESTITSKSAACDATNSVASDTAGVTFTCTATSGGGTATSAVTIKRDATAPAVSPASVVNTTWRNTSLSETFTASDAMSGLANAADATFTLTASAESADPASPTVASRTVADNAGNSTTRSVSALIDLTSPVISGSNVVNSVWRSTSLSQSFTASDALSGLAVASDANFTVTASAESTVDSDGACVPTVVSRTVTDVATNSATRSLSACIDLTNPVVNIASPTTGLTTIAPSVTVSGTALDSPSGISSVTLNGESTVYNSTTGVFSRSVTLACGPNTIEAVASDLAGRTDSDSISVTRVCFTALQYYQPLDPTTGSIPVLNVGKYGRVIPVKVTLSLAGSPVTEATMLANNWTLEIGVNGVSCSGGAAIDSVEAYADAGMANGDTNDFRWDSASQQWIYNLDTRSAPGVNMTSGLCYRLDVYLVDSDDGARVKLSTTTYVIFKPLR